MGQSIANPCLFGNTPDEFDDVEVMLIHGPSWVNWMPFDMHARSVVLPLLQRAGWKVRHELCRIDVVAPWLSEALQ